MAPPQLTRWIPRASSLAACMTGWATKLLLSRAISGPLAIFQGLCSFAYNVYGGPPGLMMARFYGAFARVAALR